MSGIATTSSVGTHDPHADPVMYLSSPGGDWRKHVRFALVAAALGTWVAVAPGLMHAVRSGEMAYVHPMLSFTIVGLLSVSLVLATLVFLALVLSLSREVLDHVRPRVMDVSGYVFRVEPLYDGTESSSKVLLGESWLTVPRDLASVLRPGERLDARWSLRTGRLLSLVRSPLSTPFRGSPDTLFVSSPESDRYDTRTP